MSLIIVMLFYGIRFLERKDFKNACLLGICAGFCGNLKISGIYVFAMIGGFIQLILTKEKKWSGKTFRGTYGNSCRFPELFGIDSGYLGAGISFVGISAVEPFKQYELFQNGR